MKNMKKISRFALASRAHNLLEVRSEERKYIRIDKVDKRKGER